MLRLGFIFLRYSFASIFLALRASQAISCGNQDSSPGAELAVVHNICEFSWSFSYAARSRVPIMTHRLHFADWVAFPVPRVFAFFSNPENLPRLMPPETATKVDSFQLVVPSALPGQDAINAHHFAGKGSIIDTSFRPIRFLSWRRKWDGCHYRIRMEPILRRYAR